MGEYAPNSSGKRCSSIKHNLETEGQQVLKVVLPYTWDTDQHNDVLLISIRSV